MEADPFDTSEFEHIEIPDEDLDPPDTNAKVEGDES